MHLGKPLVEELVLGRPRRSSKVNFRIGPTEILVIRIKVGWNYFRITFSSKLSC
jgi:hypothetical protein